mgnify:CR=1 FL=1|jgi:hypothetical protein
MSSNIELNNYTGLSVSQYKSDNIYPLLPLLSEEFPNWTVDKIKNYIKLVVSKEPNVAGMIVARNEAFYYVGLLVYTFQSVSSKYIDENKTTEFSNGLVIENLIASSPILQQQVFFLIVEKAIDLARKNKCEFVELPKFDENYRLIQNKYQSKIHQSNNFRTVITF